jgi:hypothetical protein
MNWRGRRRPLLPATDFVISLDQWVFSSKYDCSLTSNCTGCLLSYIVKMSRFMVVHKATESVTERYDHLRNEICPTLLNYGLHLFVPSPRAREAGGQSGYNDECVL